MAERLRDVTGRRVLGMTLALVLEALLVLALLSLGLAEKPAKEERAITVVNLRPLETSEQAPEARDPEPAQRRAGQPLPEQPATEQPLTRQSAELEALPTPIIIPTPYEVPRLPDIPPTPTRAAKPLYGPPDRRASSDRDTELVGTAPNGEPLYAAAWYCEPDDDELRGYLSTATGPAWGLVACRTVPGYRVEDCVGLDEYPQGSQMIRAVLAAAWQFKVRPPRRGGQTLVGSWVRIRIDYGTERR